MKKIAILGATSHIAKGLILGLSYGKYEIYLFARSLKRTTDFIKNNCANKEFTLMSFEKFNTIEYDVIINCVGIGDPGKLMNSKLEIFAITERYDNLVLDYLEKHPSALYINLSSGAVYGTDFKAPVDDLTYAQLNINHIGTNDLYGIAKLYIETKHRALVKYNIVDLRVFGYFSRFIDLSSKYFISEIISCVTENKEFITGPGNMVRDYIHPNDFICLVEKCIDRQTINDVYDVYSLAPATKFEILDYFADVYKLRYVIDDKVLIQTATGCKEHYYSKNRKAEMIGYTPRSTSLKCISKEVKAIIGK